MTIQLQPNGKLRVIHFEEKHNHEFATPVRAHLLPSERRISFSEWRISFSEDVEAELANNMSALDGVPKLGMGFDSDEHAYDFYNAYAGRIGFSFRKDYANKSKVDGGVISRRFTCFREGYRAVDKRRSSAKRPRKETRIGCLAQLVVSRQADGLYRVIHFEDTHNHELVPASSIRFLRSQKRSATIQNIESAYEGDGQGLDYNLIDSRSRLPSKRMRDMKQGESESILEYLRRKQIKDPSFFYAVQFDAEEQLTNIFWADGKMIVDYVDFGDVVCFNTVYRTNHDFRPFVLFVGVNHHKQMVIFGAALLYDASIESLKWLIRIFIETMSEKKPKTILTDQDAIVAEAVNLEMPETVHRLCAWHVYQNALEQLRLVASDLSSCIFDNIDMEDFVNTWKVMLDSYALWDNEWLNETFKERERWAIPYGRHTFCADIQRAQLCESVDTNLRKWLKSELDIGQLFKHVGKMANDWRYKELEANYDMGQHMPKLLGDVILLKHARDAYSPKVFEEFQEEYEKCLNCLINPCTESQSVVEYKVSIYGQPRDYTVMYNSLDDSVVCNCMKFEFVGILCGHALKVLDYRNIKIVPPRYILKRWKKDARA